MIELINKMVVVNANDLLYKGKLIQIDEHNVHLMTESGYIAISVDRVSSITEAQD